MSINPTSWGFIPTTAPPLPRPSEPSTGSTTSQTVVGPDGLPHTFETVVVVNRGPHDPYRFLMAYGGLTGAQENARRDMQFAMSGLEERAAMLGVNAHSSTEVGRDESQQDSELSDPTEWGQADIDGLREVGLLPPALEDAAMRALLEAAREELPNSIDNAVLGRAGENAVRSQLLLEGWENLGEQVRVLVGLDDGSFTLRIYDFVARNPFGQIEFLEVKTNGATRNPRQTRADESFEARGGIIIGNGAARSGLPFGTVVGPTPVGVVQATVTWRF